MEKSSVFYIKIFLYFYIFAGTQLTSIEIPTTVTKFYSVFANSSLTTVTFLGTTPPDPQEYEKINGCSSLTAIYAPSTAVDDYKAKFENEYAE